MNKKFTKLIAALALLVFMTPSLVMWGQTRTENVLLSEDFSSITSGNSTSTSGSSTSWSGNDNFNVSGSVYQAGGAIRLGAKNVTGGITSNSLAVSAGTLTVAFDVKGWSSIESNIKVTAGNQNETVTYTAVMSGDFESKSVTFDIATSTSLTVTIETVGTSKATYYRAFLDNVVITNTTSGGGNTPTIAIPEEQLSLGCEENTDGTFNVSYTNGYTATVAFAGLYADANCTQSFPADGEDEWIMIEVEDPNTITYMVDANPNAASRTVYLQVYAYEANYSNYLDATFAITQAGMTVAAPTFNPAGGLFHGTQNVTLSATSGASIRYTTNGTDPTAMEGTPYSEPIAITTTTTVKAIAYVTNGSTTISSEVSSATFTQEQVATPTFSPAAGAVNAGTEVTISCTTTNPTIQYSIDGGTTWTTGSSVVINEPTALKAKATATGYLPSEIATASYTLKGNAAFVDGVYSETMTTETSFNNMEVVSTVGDEKTWSFDTQYHCASIQSSNDETDWLITPKMQVQNGKLSIDFDIWHQGTAGQLSLKWSASNDVVNGTWTDLEFSEGTASSWHSINDIVIETQSQYVYVAFVYDNTSDESSYKYQIRNFTARQCNTLSVSGLTGVNTIVFAGSESEMLFEGAGSASVGAGLNVMVSVDVAEGYELTSLLVNNVEHKDDIDGGMYQFTMPNENVTVTASATRLPYYTVSLTTNGIADGTLEVTQGQAIGTLPTATAEYIPEGYTFIGWLATDYEVSNTAPEGLITADYTPSADVTLKAVFAIETPGTATIKTDNLTTSTFGSPSSYSTWSDKSATGGSDAVYAGNSTTYNSNAIQIRATKLSGIVSTTSGGKAKKVTVSWNNDTQTGRTLDVYGKNVAYTGSANLYNDPSNTQGTKLGSIVCGTSTELTISGDYQYIGMRSNSNAMYIDQISIEWESSTPSTYSNYRTLMQETCTLTITGYNNGGGWNLIASPVTMTPSTNDIITEDDNEQQRTYDLYYFDQTSESEWKNYRQNSFNLVPGKGYLYANKTGGSYTLTGTPYNGDGIIPLYYSEANPSESMRGLNLIGNPYNANTTIESDREFYIMNSAGSQIIVADDDHKTIAPMQGIFVKAEEPGESVTFTPASQGSSLNNNSSLVLNLIQNRGDVVDRAIVRLGNGGTLPKIQLFENSTKLYISQYNEDYAVVKAEAQGEMPVNFRAAENGTYTLSIDAENVEMNYLHLIDNMTGKDIDLLQTPSYTFNATTRDYESRFRLVFAANNEDGVSTGSGTFAFYSNGNWVINNDGEATLQVIDVTGRILSSENVNGSVSTTLNATPGVYMLRLINGENVKVQKIVVR